MDANQAQNLQPGEQVRWIPTGDRAKVVQHLGWGVWLLFEDGITGGYRYIDMQLFEKVEVMEACNV